MTESRTALHPADEVAWKAFQYVCGEMPAEVQSAFEAELEADQSAREAVAAAVELMAGIQIACRDSVVGLPQPAREVSGAVRPAIEFVPGRAVSRGQRIRPLLALGTACALMAWLGHQESWPTRPAGGRESRSATLIQRWTAQRANVDFEMSDLEAWPAIPSITNEELASEDPASNPTDDGGELAELADDEIADGGDNLDDDEVVVPGWLLAAVVAERRASFNSPELVPEN